MGKKASSPLTLPDDSILSTHGAEARFPSVRAALRKESCPHAFVIIRTSERKLGTKWIAGSFDNHGRRTIINLILQSIPMNSDKREIEISLRSVIDRIKWTPLAFPARSILLALAAAMLVFLVDPSSKAGRREFRLHLQDALGPLGFTVDKNRRSGRGSGARLRRTSG